jgi:acyl-CoA synthetase (AMP-forming)/AMP-acid ligase II/thioesterase domain-containing protein
MDQSGVVLEREICSEVRRWAGNGRPAVLAPGREPLDFAQLAGQLDAVSAVLAGRGLRRGDAVALVLPDGPEFLTAFLGVTQAAVCAPLNPNFREEEFAYYLADLRAQALVLPAGSGSPARAVAARLGIEVLELTALPGQPAGCLRLDPGAPGRRSAEPAFPLDTALLLHTSATTGRPKLVPLTHGQLLAMVEVAHRSFPPMPGSRTLAMVPGFHMHCLLLFLIQLCAGNSVVAAPGFQPANFLKWMAEFAPTSYSGNPTLHRAVLSLCAGAERHPALASLRYVTSTGALLTLETQAELERRLGVPVVDGYGMTEVGRVTVNPLDPSKRKDGSVGPCVGPEVAILGPEGRFLEPGQAGEILLRGPMVMRGYAHNPEANAVAFHGDWFRTGDLGYLDADGYLFITGRIKEMINRGAEKVLPYEVEAVLGRHPEVQEVAVFGFPHPRLGEEVGAAVVPVPGGARDAEALRRFAAQFLADFKVPRKVVFLDDIPKGRTGKYQRARLAELLGVAAAAAEAEAAEAPVAAGAPEDPLRAQVAAIWCELLKQPQAREPEDFFEAGGDSLLALTLMARVEEVTGRQLQLADLGGALTFGALLAALRPAGAGSAPEVPGIHVLRNGGGGAPLFFLHGVYSFKRLLPVLDEHNPVFALEPPDEATLLETAGVPGLVDVAVDRIRQVRAHGPYLLGGHSMGGLVAFETARRLLDAGERVLGVVMLDSDPLGYRSGSRSYRWLTALQYQALRVKSQVQALSRMSPGRWKEHILGRLQQLAHRDPYKLAQSKVLEGFELRPLAVPTVLFRCLDEDPGRARQLGRRWAEMVGPGLQVVDVAGDHETVLRSPQIEALGRHLAGWLARVDPPGKEKLGNG